MPRTPEQNEKIKEVRSNSILIASLKLFAVVGLNNVSVDLITQTVNCSHGLFYHYYDNVLDIYKKILESSDKFDFEPFSLKEILEMDGFDGLKKVCYYFGSERVLNDSFLCYAKLFLQEQNEEITNEFLYKHLRLNSINEVIIELVKKGQESGDVINGDPAIIARGIRMFLLTYVTMLSDNKRKDRTPMDPKVLIGFIVKKSVK